jgi:hypothetical protein
VSVEGEEDVIPVRSDGSKSASLVRGTTKLESTPEFMRVLRATTPILSIEDITVSADLSERVARMN